MNLNALRHMQMLRGGEIRAWALTGANYERIIGELTDHEPHFITWSSDVRIFGVPVVFVRPGEPEGVIV